MYVAAPLEPIFLHSLWRTGSTYLFGKFREADRFYCLYEPLHEFMRRLDERKIRKFSEQQRAARLNHRPMAGGYFDEYRPLQRKGARGIPGYRDSMAIAEYFAEDNPCLREYIASLVAACQSRQRQPLLQFCRTSGRFTFFRNSFDGMNVYLQRDPRDQWQSYVSGERPYFMPMTIAIATLREPYAAQLSTILDRPLPRSRSLFGLFRHRSVRRTLRAARRFERKLDDADRYRIFYADWLRAAREAERHCDLIIDINRISHDRRARREIENAFSIRLDDCQVKEYQEHRLPPFSMLLIERQVAELFEDAKDQSQGNLRQLAKAA